MKLFKFLLSGSFLLLQAQPISVGVKGGFVLTDALRSGNDESRNYTVGPTVEFRLPRNFGIETGFLYKRIGDSVSFQFADSRVHYTNRGNSFEVPVIGKYYFTPSRLFTPYLGLGAAVRRTWQTMEGSVVFSSDPTDTFKREDVSSFGVGAVGAAGVQFRHGRWKLSPEFRYTRWSAESQRLARNPNQVEFLFGISF
jgi:hypothetical protein